MLSLYVSIYTTAKSVLLLNIYALLIVLFRIVIEEPVVFTIYSVLHIENIRLPTTYNNIFNAIHNYIYVCGGAYILFFIFFVICMESFTKEIFSEKKCLLLSVIILMTGILGCVVEPNTLTINIKNLLLCLSFRFFYRCLYFLRVFRYKHH